MSYYTAPSDLQLMPVHLLVSARTDARGDVDIQQFVTRDLRCCSRITNKLRSAAHTSAQRPAINVSLNGHSKTPIRPISNCSGLADKSRKLDCFQR